MTSGLIRPSADGPRLLKDATFSRPSPFTVAPAAITFFDSANGFIVWRPPPPWLPAAKTTMNSWLVKMKVRVSGFLDVLVAAGAPAVGVNPRAPVLRHRPEVGDGVEIDRVTIRREVLHLDEGVERLAIVRSCAAVRSCRVAIVHVPHAIIAGDAPGGVRPVVDAVIVVVASARRAWRAVVVLDLAVIGSRRRVVRVGEVRVAVVEARVAQGHELTGAEDPMIVNRGRECVRVPALDDPAGEVVHDRRLHPPVDVHRAGDARKPVDLSLVELDADGSGLPPRVDDLSASEHRGRLRNVGDPRFLKGGDLHRDPRGRPNPRGRTRGQGG